MDSWALTALAFSNAVIFIVEEAPVCCARVMILTLYVSLLEDDNQHYFHYG